MPGAVLDVIGLNVHLDSRPILSDVSFSIPPAAIVGLFGESGCGKTTLALAILNLLPAVYRIQGAIRLDSTDLLTLCDGDLQPIRGARISMVPQDPLLALNPVIRVADQIDEVRRAHPDRALDLPAIFSLVGLPESRRRAYPHQLSGGERQRVLLAQAIACRPALIVADEPFTALDAARILDLSALFRRLQAELGTSFLIISHSPGVLAEVAGEVLVMYAGRIVERGPAAEVLGSPHHPYTAGLLQSLKPRPDGRLYSIPGNPTTLPMPGCPFEPRCDDRLDRCRAAIPPEEFTDAGRGVRCFRYAG